ncbi:PIN domain-containing protein [uncultured Thiodictyon sp.]
MVSRRPASAWIVSPGPGARCRYRRRDLERAEQVLRRLAGGAPAPVGRGPAGSARRLHDGSGPNGPLRAALYSLGKPLAPLDLMIAAHALAEGVILITADRAFSQVPGLCVQDYDQ